MKRFLKSLAYRLYDARKKRIFFACDHGNNYNLTKTQITRARRLGFTADEYVIYNLEKNDPGDYISEFERSLYRDAMRDFRVMLDNKIVFYNIIRNFAAVNTMYAYRRNGLYVALEAGFDRVQLFDRLRELGKIVYKTNFAGGGKGFHLLEFDGEEYKINRSPATWEDVNALLDTPDYILEEYCVQGDFENALFPYSVNTIRVITAVDTKQNFSILLALQRIGMDADKCVDNGYAGGVLAKIDLDSGKINAAQPFANGRFLDENGSCVAYKVHPATGAPIEGQVIPNWESIKEETLQLHRKLHFMDVPMIAWDIALTDNGFKIIEANISCSMEIQYLYGGLRNKAFGQWLKERGYIK